MERNYDGLIQNLSTWGWLDGHSYAFSHTDSTKVRSCLRKGIRRAIITVDMQSFVDNDGTVAWIVVTENSLQELHAIAAHAARTTVTAATSESVSRSESTLGYYGSLVDESSDDSDSSDSESEDALDESSDDGPGFVTTSRTQRTTLSSSGVSMRGRPRFATRRAAGLE